MSLVLPPHRRLIRPSGPVILAILDGVGRGAGGEDDAVAQAHTPVLDLLAARGPHTWLRAHGTAVGLPSDADMGNSEVGHNAMGAGRVFDQGAKLVDNAIACGSAFAGDVWARLCTGHTLHLLGLISDGNVHSHIDQLRALIARAASDGVTRLRVHGLTDGRDVGKRTALTWFQPLEQAFAEHQAAGRDYRFASGGGRMGITMDRYEADWDMVERGWQCHVRGVGRPFPSATEAIETMYAEAPDVDDQWLPAFVVHDDHGPVGRIEDGDSVLFFNFRGDRALEICRAFDGEVPFERPGRPKVFFAGLMEYDGDLHIPAHYLVSPPAIDRTMGEYLVTAGLRTFACSETQKYGHVTFFFNGNRSGRIDDALETYLEIPSDLAPFEERPWMKAAEIGDAAVRAIRSGSFDHVRVNFANGDMVGHTGDLRATRIAVEAVDLQVGRLLQVAKQTGAALLVTADHGNADEMWMHKKGEVVRDHEGEPVGKTSHTLNPVPFSVYDPRGGLTIRAGDHSIAAVGTTVIELLGLQPPSDYVEGLLSPA